MNSCNLFFEAAKKYPNLIAIVDRKGNSIHFGDLAQEVENMSAYFRNKGISKGDRVLVFLPMGIPLYRSILALFRIGAVAVFLDEWVSKERLEVCCKLAKCKAFIAPLKIKILALFSRELRKIPIWFGSDFKKGFAPGAIEDMLERETALITFTTGSTGIPKAADRTHGFLNAQFSALLEEITPDEGTIDMPVLPIVTLLNLGSGIPSVIADYNSRKPASLKPKRIREQILQYGVNRLIASPYFIEQIAIHAYQFPNKDQQQLQRIYTGGAPVYPDQAKKMMHGYPNSEIHILYGSTEAEPISRITANDLIKQNFTQGLSVGYPAKVAKVLILPITEDAITITSTQDLLEKALTPNQVGEIIVSGDHVLRRYIDNPDAIRMNKLFIGNQVWHRTGDSGYLDGNGQLFLCGRATSLLYDQKGKILAPFLWENRLSNIEDIIAGTILKRKNEIIAIIEQKNKIDINIIREKILNLYPFDEIIYLDHIPRDPRHFSKIDYGKLKQILGIH